MDGLRCGGKKPRESVAPQGVATAGETLQWGQGLRKVTHLETGGCLRQENREVDPNHEAGASNQYGARTRGMSSRGRLTT
jgi:hypothetical protein